jgi:cytochrome c peroxidase
MLLNACPSASTEKSRDGMIIDLGRRLFFERKLSADGAVSCATCHDPKRAFSDGRTRAIGALGKMGTRNAPSLLDVGTRTELMWDGRVSSLEEQVGLPLTNPIEHDLRDRRTVVAILKKEAAYVTAFRKAFASEQDSLSFENAAIALAAYERTLHSPHSAFDRYTENPSAGVLPSEAVRGLALFRGKARCDSCHPLDTKAGFTDQLYHRSPVPLPPELLQDLGPLAEKVRAFRLNGDAVSLNQLLSLDGRAAALGRFVVTLDPSDIGAFRTPPLRNVALTAPYMHDGSVADLPTAIEKELYSRGSSREPIILTSQEREDLLQFLLSL